MNSEAKGKPESLGRLRHSPWAEPRLANRSVKEEMRENLLCGLGEGGTLFPGIHGYEDTVIPQIGRKGLSLISQPATTGISASKNCTRPRRMRLFAWPRRPSRMKLCRARIAFTTCGMTVSS